MVLQIEISSEKLILFCKKHHIRKLSFFGSVLRKGFCSGRYRCFGGV